MVQDNGQIVVKNLKEIYYCIQSLELPGSDECLALRSLPLEIALKIHWKLLKNLIHESQKGNLNDSGEIETLCERLPDAVRLSPKYSTIVKEIKDFFLESKL